MRIGVDLRSLTEAQPTGVAEYTRALVQEMLRQAPEHEFRLYVSGLRDVELPDLGQKKHPRATVKWLRQPNKWLSLSTSVAHRPTVDSILGGLDVFFSPNFNFIALGPRVPHVLTVHDLSFELFPSFFSFKRRLWHRAVRTRVLAKNAAHLICDSKSTADDLADIYNIALERISVIPLGVDPKILTKKVEKPKDPEMPENYVLAVGTVEPRKNLAALISAFEKARIESKEPFGLVIAGPMGWKTRQFWAAVKACRYVDDIKVLGFVSRQQRAALYSRAACALAISSYEGFGLPALEALSADVPVIAAQVSSLPEVTGRAAILVDPERPDQIAEALVCVLQDHNLRTELIQAGQKRTELFGWEKTARETLNVLESVAANVSV